MVSFVNGGCMAAAGVFLNIILKLYANWLLLFKKSFYFVPHTALSPFSFGYYLPLKLTSIFGKTVLNTHPCRV